MYTIFNETYNYDDESFVYNNKSFFYSVEGSTVVLKTKMMSLSDFDNNFCDYIFNKHFLFCNKLILEKIDIDRCVIAKTTGFIKYKGKKVFYEISDQCNNRLILPDSIEEYIATLGKKTRQHLKWYQRQLEKDFSEYDIEYVIEDSQHSNKETIETIISLLHRRRKNRGLVCVSDANEIQKILSGYNVNCYLKVNGKIVAGTISSIYNGVLNLHYISHDDAFNEYNVGNLILLKTIDYAISQKIKIFNFLWGNNEYKNRFGAVEQKLYNLYFFRNSWLFWEKFFQLKLKETIPKIINYSKKIIKFLFYPVYFIIKGRHNRVEYKQNLQSVGYIFMLHRVDDFEDGRLWCNEHMKVTPLFLDQALAKLKQNYDLIPLEEVPNRLNNKRQRRFIAFTMDDGYKDNYTKALPVFKKHNVPYTIFVTTDFLDRKAILWWYVLEDLLLSNDHITLSNGVTYPARYHFEKCDSFLKIREEILKLDQLDLENELNKLFADYKINWTKQCEKLCMSWDDIKALKNEPLVTIGAHTQHHYNLKALAAETDVRQEVENGVKILKEKAGIDSTVFAYPFGSDNEAGEREFEVLSKMSFSLACRATGGACFQTDARNMYSLPRIMFKHDFKIEDLQ